MKASEHPTKPPRWAQRLLRWYCRPDLLEDLQGDLNEYFERNLTAKGPTRARLIYVIDVLKFFRTYTIRKPDFINLLIHWIMIGSYFKTSRRSLIRNKLFSAINIIGLSVSMSIGLLVIAFVSDLRSYDDFHEKRARIYRILTKDDATGRPTMELATTSHKAGLMIREAIPGVGDLTIIQREFSGDAKVNEETIIPIKALWADHSFFKVFTFPLIAGDSSTALREPYSLILTEKTANKLFGTTDALGKSVQFDTVAYTVTGIMKDIPKLSHLKFEALISLASLGKARTAADRERMDWSNIYGNFVYLTIPDNQNLHTIQTTLNRLSAAENQKLKNRKITLSLQPLSTITLGKRYANEFGANVPSLVIWIVAGLAFVIILSACFNYTNLSIARSLRRTREVGIRKIVGALKGHVLGQFVMESVIIALLALAFSSLLFFFLRHQFLALAPQLNDIAQLELSPRLILYFLFLAVLVGIVAGFLPALFFSRIKAIQVLKATSSIQLFRHINLRKSLIVLQYTISLVFITSTIIGYRQYKSFLSFDLGFSTENILNINLQGNNGDLLINELKPLSAVNKISKSSIVTSLGSLVGTSMKYNDAQDSSLVWLNYVDKNYIPIHKHTFLAGSNFTITPKKDAESEVIVNEQVLKRFAIAGRDPHKAIGEQITMDKQKLRIIGVLKDFHYGTMENKIEPMALRHITGESGGYLNVSITSTDVPATLASIDQAWRKIDKIHPLDAKFYDDQIEEAYRQFMVITQIIGFITFLAIVIASMGLFGMVVFTAETRLKEISIRKVLGASEVKLVYLLSRGFLALLAIATLIALPATYLLFDRIILSKFAYHKPISINDLTTGVLIVMLIAFLLIASQTVKVARRNPANVLKSD